MLWKLRFKGKTSYLLGTCHTVPLSVLPKPVREIIERATSIVLETMEPFSEEDLFPLGVDNTQPPTREFYESLPENLKNELNLTLKFYSLVLHRTILPEELGPRRILLLLSNAYYKMSLGIDFSLLKMARNKRIGLYELDKNNAGEDLETPFAECNDEQLISSIEYLKTNSNSEALESLMSEYIENFFNPDSIEVNLEIFGSLNSEHAILAERNSQWIPKMQSLHLGLQESVLFAVGYAHLMGNQGLLNILQCSGFQLERMKEDGSFIPVRLNLPLVNNAEQLIAANKMLKSLKPTAPRHETLLLKMFESEKMKTKEAGTVSNKLQAPSLLSRVKI